MLQLEAHRRALGSMLHSGRRAGVAAAAAAAAGGDDKQYISANRLDSQSTAAEPEQQTIRCLAIYSGVTCSVMHGESALKPAVQWKSLVQLMPLAQEEGGRLCLQQLVHKPRLAHM